jgi:hypothetical protein
VPLITVVFRYDAPIVVWCDADEWLVGVEQEIRLYRVYGTYNSEGEALAAAAILKEGKA